MFSYGYLSLSNILVPACHWGLTLQNELLRRREGACDMSRPSDSVVRNSSGWKEDTGGLDNSHDHWVICKELKLASGETVLGVPCRSDERYEIYYVIFENKKDSWCKPVAKVSS